MKAESGEKKVVENYHKDITSGHHPGRATSSLGEIALFKCYGVILALY
jgi:hypothetical protein